MEAEVTIATMTDSRKNILNMIRDLKARYLTGKFSKQDLVKDFRYNAQSADIFLNALAKNGMLNMTVTPNNTIYHIVNDPEAQISNVMGWINYNKKEIAYYEMMIQVIMAEINKPEMTIETNDNPTGTDQN